MKFKHLCLSKILLSRHAFKSNFIISIRNNSSASRNEAVKDPVGIVMLNMGGPGSLDGVEDGVEPFLQRLFGDREIIQLGPLQKILVSSA